MNHHNQTKELTTWFLNKPSYNSMPFNYINMSSSTAYTYIHVGKAHHFDETNYNQWKHCMKNYLYSISPDVWQVVCDGVDFSDEDGQPTSDQLQKIHSNDVLERIMNYEMNIQESNNIKNHYKGAATSKKQDIAFKATNKSKKKKKAIIKSPSEEDEDEKEYDEDGIALFIKKFIIKRRPFKEDRKEKPRSMMVCYNCGKNEYFIAQCTYERKEKDNEKKKKFDKCYKKDKKFTKKKSYGQANVGKE
jgi:hypothetical protein